MSRLRIFRQEFQTRCTAFPPFLGEFRRPRKQALPLPKVDRKAEWKGNRLGLFSSGRTLDVCVSLSVYFSFRKNLKQSRIKAWFYCSFLMVIFMLHFQACGLNRLPKHTSQPSFICFVHTYSYGRGRRPWALYGAKMMCIQPPTSSHEEEVLCRVLPH